MSVTHHLLLGVMGAGIVLLLIAATANVVDMGSRIAIDQEESGVLLREVDPYAPRIVVFPPSGSIYGRP